MTLRSAPGGAAGEVRGRGTDAVAARLAAFLASWQARYTLPGGASVTVTSAFRMSTEEPRPDRSPEVLLRKLARALPLASVPAAERRTLAVAMGRAVWGRASPEQVRLLTQRLIDAGALAEVRRRAGRALSDFEAVRLMQVRHGIGIDCSGYVRQAFEAAVQRRGHGLPGSGVRRLASNPAFVAVRRPEEARPGDIIDLGAPSTARPEDYDDPRRHLREETAGHFVIVAARRRLGELERRRLGLGGAFAGANVHLFEVHSSWGGPRTLARGGVGVRLWLYDADRGRWAQLERAPGGRLRVQPSAHRRGPVDHPLDGIYRARRAK